MIATPITRTLLSLLVIIVSFAPLHAQQTTTAGGIIYTLNADGTATVTGHTDELPSNLTIPEAISVDGRNFRVTSIGESAFYGSQILTSAVIPNSVTTIDSYAFSACYSLATVLIPNSVTTIGGYAFRSCTSLISIYLPASATDIAVGYNSLFGNCTGLQQIIVDSDNPKYSSSEGILYDKAKTTLLLFPEGKSSADIPATVSTIGDYAFSMAQKLTSIAIPGNVITIGNAAFRGCGNLVSVSIPNSVTTIGRGAFYWCN